MIKVKLIPLFLYFLIFYSVSYAQTTLYRVFFATTIEARAAMVAAGVSESSLIDKAMLQIRTAYSTNSQIPINFQLGGYYPWNYNEGTSWTGGFKMIDDLLWFEAMGNTEIVTLREGCGASIGVLFVSNANDITGVAGQTSGIGSSGYGSSVMKWDLVHMDNPCRVLPHEIGHNFGLEDCSGYCVTKLRTIMTYMTPDCPQGCVENTPSIEYFSTNSATNGIYYTQNSINYAIGDASHDNRQNIINHIENYFASKSYATPPWYPVSNTNFAYTFVFQQNSNYDAITKDLLTVSATAKNGSSVNLRCNTAVTLTNGFTVEPTAKVNVTSGTIALGKKRIEPDVQMPEWKNNQLISKPQSISVMQNKNGGLRIRFSSQTIEQVPLEFSIVNCSGQIFKKDRIATFRDGYCIDFGEEKPNGIYIIKGSIGNKMFSQLFSIQR